MELENEKKRVVSGEEVADLQKKCLKVLVEILSQSIGDRDIKLRILFECARLLELGRRHRKSLIDPKDAMGLLAHLEMTNTVSSSGGGKSREKKWEISSKRMQAMRLALTRGVAQS
eukprot:CAMPEP_0167746534 /NCGR_PEP_ID=MMETSP0110_2-20121227/3764_1 /TAXON_ID=629695 /ORGANISM="Gymnochlora sp., Strain CCMP2014" /LENGTH=115 /DNA_ID=CAMNT_0007631305 /DNA_START=597 /DNA_END=941 /DNA_ORIENTATION=+